MNSSIILNLVFSIFVQRDMKYQETSYHWGVNFSYN